MFLLSLLYRFTASMTVSMNRFIDHDETHVGQVLGVSFLKIGAEINVLDERGNCPPRAKCLTGSWILALPLGCTCLGGKGNTVISATEVWLKLTGR